MLQRTLQAALCPVMPRRFQLTFQRWSAGRMRSQCHDRWPINEAAGRRPENWAGWPENKQFAFVLTHDVDGADGVAQCPHVARLERELGFRSCFNFPTDRADRQADAQRTWLRAQGFEIGVHAPDPGPARWLWRPLVHKTGRINRCIREWSCAGFRSGGNSHGDPWLHQLEIEYDSSSRDTVPFAPPDRTGSIFPSWIATPRDRNGAPPAINGSSTAPERGYVELPRTLADDTLLFLELQESSPEVWLRKLDWIATHGGMALVNVHPGRMAFENDAADRATYPAARFRAFLEYVRARYDGAFWQPLPRQLASFVRALTPPPTPRPVRRVSMITHSFYENDGRVTRYAEALASRGDAVEVFALRRNASLPARETISGVELHRIQMRPTKSLQSRLAYAWPLLRFLVRSSWEITRRHLHRRYDVVHVHNIPDFLVFSAWLPKVCGDAVVLDIHDVVPEFYGSKFAIPHGPTLALLKRVERLSARYATHVIIANHLWLEKYATRTGTQGRCSVFINNVDTRVFRPGLRTRHDGRLIVMFPGGLQWHQGLDLAVRAFQTVAAALPEAEFHIYGDGNMKPALVALTVELGLTPKVRFFNPVPTAAIVAIMANADLGVVPKRADSFGNEAYSTKIMEFMSLGVPVVVSETQIDRYYFNDSVVRFFESGNVEALAEAIIEVLRDRQLRQRLIESGLEYSRRHSWDTRKGAYLQLVDSLCA